MRRIAELIRKRKGVGMVGAEVFGCWWSVRKRKRAKLSLDPSIVLVVDCNRSFGINYSGIAAVRPSEIPPRAR